MENKSQKHPCEVSIISCLLLRAWKANWAAGRAEHRGGLVDSLGVSGPQKLTIPPPHTPV